MVYSFEKNSPQRFQDRQLSEYLFTLLVQQYPAGEVVEFQTERRGYNGRDLQNVPAGRYKVVSAFRESTESVNSGFYITVHEESDSTQLITIALSRDELSSTAKE